MKITSTYKFVHMGPGKVEQEFPTFKEAFTAMYKHVKAEIASGGITLQILETAIWIECPAEEGTEIESHTLVDEDGTANTLVLAHPVVLYFYDARDRAYDEGILRGRGELVE